MIRIHLSVVATNAVLVVALTGLFGAPLVPVMVGAVAGGVISYLLIGARERH